jgi:hypothetical protein
MARARIPLPDRRRPLGIYVSPATFDRLRRITADLDLPWSRGSIIDRALEIAETQLLTEAEGRQIVVLLGSFTDHDSSAPT